ncbi:MAG: hypothetical protein GTO63_29870 [Anaerolineae bacterium]|nr:hypothetical protein [Anaerolineae bacterium]NIN98922.1 hypothetical protein [Anaerolineae bacterium]
MRDSAGLEEATRRRPKRQPQVPERRRKEQQLSRLFGEAALEAASIITGADQSKLHGSKIKARLHRLAVDAAFEELDAFEKRAGRAER